VRVWYDLKRYYDANLLPVAICRGSTITSGEMDRRKVSTRLWSIGAPKKARFYLQRIWCIICRPSSYYHLKKAMIASERKFKIVLDALLDPTKNKTVQNKQTPVEALPDRTSAAIPLFLKLFVLMHSKRKA
jgi:hypothetical protein